MDAERSGDVELGARRENTWLRSVESKGDKREDDKEVRAETK